MSGDNPSPLDGLVGGDAPMADCVLSSRVRLARNLVGFHFVNRCSPEQLSDVVHRVQSARLGGPFESGVRWVNVQGTTPVDRLLLFERNLISRPFVESPHPRCVAISADESTSVMVNEEDHLRLQMLAPGMQLRELSNRMLVLDSSVERSLEYAFHPRFGYLTACTTNVGTGIRVSAMLHLPALALVQELEKVQRAARDDEKREHEQQMIDSGEDVFDAEHGVSAGDFQHTGRGFHGEGTEALGDFYQVSNQTTLGRSEQDIVEQFAGSIVPQFVEYERAARRALIERDPTALDDRVHRALGVLRACRQLSLEESIKFLARVRLGVALGRIEGVSLGLINQLLLQVQPAHLSRATGCALGNGRDDRGPRADFVRSSLR